MYLDSANKYCSAGFNGLVKNTLIELIYIAREKKAYTVGRQRVWPI